MPVSDESLVISQKKLKLLLGGLAIALPSILYLGNLWFYNVSEPLGSISGYYYSDMRDVLVGILFAMGVFMITYEGYALIDRILSVIGGALIIVVALAPTNAPGEARDTMSNIHLLAAALFYLILVIFCLFLFTKTKKDGTMTRLKRIRNIIYYICGILLLASLVLLVLTEASDLDLSINNSTFWLEYAANLSFGIAWLVKGEGVFFLNDDPIEEMNSWEIFGIILMVFLFISTGYMLISILVL